MKLPPIQQQRVVEAVHGLMDQGRQEDRFEGTSGSNLESRISRPGSLVAHLYPDVAPAMKKWVASGLEVRIYSSGSVGAQKLLFGHTEAGDLLLIAGHFDTRIGGKRDADSYRRIAREVGYSPESFLFVSDVPAELDAAQEGRDVRGDSAFGRTTLLWKTQTIIPFGRYFPSSCREDSEAFGRASIPLPALLSPPVPRGSAGAGRAGMPRVLACSHSLAPQSFPQPRG